MKFHLVRIGAAAFFGSIPNFANGIVYFEPFDCNQPIRLFQLIDELFCMLHLYQVLTEFTKDFSR